MKGGVGGSNYEAKITNIEAKSVHTSSRHEYTADSYSDMDSQLKFNLKSVMEV